MTAYKTYVTIQDPNQLVLADLPFQPGQKVEVRIKVIDEKHLAAAQKLQALFKETQAMPSSQEITEEEIAAEIEAYRRGE